MPVQEAARAAILSPFFTVNRSFFMSLFFMISGYFMIGAHDRNGAAAFIRGRLVRLGVPVLAFAAIARSPSRGGLASARRRGDPLPLELADAQDPRGSSGAVGPGALYTIVPRMPYNHEGIRT